MKTLAALREAKGLTREQVAQAANLSVSGYINIELGHRRASFKASIRLSKVLDITLEELDAIMDSLIKAS